MESRKRRTRGLADARGSALLVSLMVMVVLTLLGIAYLMVAGTENQIAANQRDRTQNLGVAEAGARMVKRWFDVPTLGTIAAPDSLFLNTYDLRYKRYWDVNQRRINLDGDPGTPTVNQGDAGWAYYMQGRLASGSPVADTDANHAVKFMQKPYRGSPALTFMGTEDGPDLRISEDSASADVRNLLAGINAALFTDTTRTGRITRIEIFEPPHVLVGGTWQRFGIATVKVTAAKFRPAPGGVEEKVAERVVKMVLNELPVPLPGGPLQSCGGGLSAWGAFKAHWGEITAMSDVDINFGSLDTRFWSSVPYADPYTRIDIPTFMANQGGGAGTEIEDPWLAMRASGAYPNAPNANPIPVPYVPPPGYDPPKDHSNVIQFDATVGCPFLDYTFWKNVAQAGGDNIHYYTWDTGELFQENGVGTSKLVVDWVDDEEGFFFYDTTDGNPPAADLSNLTPEIVTAGDWFTRGFVYFNATDFGPKGGIVGEDYAMIQPGEPYADLFIGGSGFTGVYNAEPFIDLDGDKVWDVGETFTDTIPPANGGTDGVYDAEPWVNLNYDTVMGASDTPPFLQVQTVTGDETFTANTALQGNVARTTTNARDDEGLPVVGNLNMVGVMYNAGVFSKGSLTFYGSVISGSGLASGNQDLFYDERLGKGEWPPPELKLPVTMITVWQTDL